MIEDIKKEAASIRILVILLIIAVGIHLWEIAWSVLTSFADVIIVIIFSWLLSFALEPIVNFFSNHTRLPRVWAAVATYAILAVLFALLIYFYVPAVEQQVTKLLAILPQKLQSAPPFVYRWGTLATSSLDNAFSYIPSIANFLFSLFIVLLVSFYLVIDKDNIQKEIYSLTPKTWRKNIRFVEEVINKTFASFLRLQLLFGIMGGITTFVVLLAFGIDFAAVSALISGILIIIPLVGPILAIIPPLLAAVIVDPTKAVIIGILLIILQQIELNVIGPKLMGQAFKLHPIIVLLSFLVGIKIAGGIGAVFAVPVLGILVVVFREFGHYIIGSDDKDEKDNKK